MNPNRVARNVSTAAVATIAAWSSWSHMVHVALKFGERPEVAYVLPISVDGMLIVASTAMVEDKRSGRSVRWSARIAFAAGVATSVAANIAAAQPTVGARIVAAWPAVAMLLVVEMLSRGRTPIDPTATTRSAGDNRPAVDTHETEPEGAPMVSTMDPVSVERPATSVDGPFNGGGRLRPRRTGRSHRTVDVVARIRAERPDASPADIAKEVGVSERHVRRLLTSQT
jgi:hypothetical protein